jgi:hypothetical protein
MCVSGTVPKELKKVYPVEYLGESSNEQNQLQEYLHEYLRKEYFHNRASSFFKIFSLIFVIEIAPNVFPRRSLNVEI